MPRALRLSLSSLWSSCGCRSMRRRITAPILIKYFSSPPAAPVRSMYTNSFGVRFRAFFTVLRRVSGTTPSRSIARFVLCGREHAPCEEPPSASSFFPLPAALSSSSAWPWLLPSSPLVPAPSVLAARVSRRSISLHVACSIVRAALLELFAFPVTHSPLHSAFFCPVAAASHLPLLPARLVHL